MTCPTCGTPIPGEVHRETTGDRDSERLDVVTYDRCECGKPLCLECAANLSGRLACAECAEIDAAEGAEILAEAM